MPVGCYKQMSAIKEGVIMRLQCIIMSFLKQFELTYISPPVMEIE